MPRATLSRISDNLYCYRDTCNVYVITDGDRAVLIDCGDGGVLEHLGELGISKVDWILHTHHHRDQCQGDHKAVARRIPIAVPQHERNLFCEVENFWRNRRIFHLYYVRNNYFALTESVPVARELRDYETFKWGRHRFLIFPTPGHTPGSITLIAEIDGQRVAFSGDLIHSPGKVVALHELQYNYGSNDGVDMAIWSLETLRRQAPQLLAPSHGEPMQNPDSAMRLLIERLRAWHRFYSGTDATTIDYRLQEVSPHLIAGSSCCANFYAIMADSGKALFVDYGSASGNFFGVFNQDFESGERMRFVEHSIDELRARWGLKRIDLALPSHLHDDHINGFPYLQRHHGTRIWAYENMVELLENPRAQNVGCVLSQPVKVERGLREGEEFEWEGFRFRVVQSPGHAEQQMAMFAEIDGRRIAFTGDNYFKGERVIRHNVIFRNHIEKDSHLISVMRMLEFEPQVICPGHGGPFEVTREDLQVYQDRMQEQKGHFEALVAGETNFGLDPSWACIWPYQSQARRGESFDIEVRIRNYHPEDVTAAAFLKLPAGWRSDPEHQSASIEPNATARLPFAVSVPKGFRWPHRRLAIAADVTLCGQRFGQVAEGVVDLA